MVIEDETLEFLIARDNQQSGSRDRNIELFMYHFGFMNAAWPIYEETGREYGHSKQNANEIVDNILSVFKLHKQPLPTIQKFVGIISPIKIIRTSLLTQILIENGLVNSV